MNSSKSSWTGAVLVGAGSGDPQLLTLAAVNWLARAEVVIYDRLIDPSLLELCPADAERIYAGKGPHGHAMEQDEINRVLVEQCRAGKLVVRLKGGDPFVFGRGGEEADALCRANLPFRIVPGVTAGIAGSAYAGIPVTDRRMASSLALVTGHEDPSKSDSSLNWPALAGIDTVVFYMGVANLAHNARQLIAAGKAADTPAAVIENATTPRQRTVVSTLGQIAQAAADANIRPPAITVVGPVVNLRPQVAWLEKLPLFGQTILVTRSRSQASELSASLRELGADVLEAPTIQIEPPDDWTPLDLALRQLAAGEPGYDWLVLTSPAGVPLLMNRLRSQGLDARSLARTKVTAVGAGTAAALQKYCITADLVPADFTTAALGETLAQQNLANKRVLLARADIATPELAALLTDAKAQIDEVTLYRNVAPAQLPQRALDALRKGHVDWITFTSSSTVNNFLALTAGENFDYSRIRLAAIGPVTARALESHNLTPAVVAAPHTIEALVKAVLLAAGPR